MPENCHKCMADYRGISLHNWKFFFLFEILADRVLVVVLTKEKKSEIA